MKWNCLVADCLPALQQPPAWFYIDLAVYMAEHEEQPSVPGTVAGVISIEQAAAWLK